MEGGTQAVELREEGSGSNISKFSLLGRQLTHFFPLTHHHHQQQQQLIPSPEHLGCSLGAPQAPPPPPSYCFPPLTHSPFTQSHLASSAVLPNSCQVLPIALAQNFSTEMCSELSTPAQEDIPKPNTSGSSPVAVEPSVSPSVVGAINLLQQKVSQLHSLVQLMFECGHEGNASLCQQQASIAAGVATFISQLALTTAGMLQLPWPQQQPSWQAFPELGHLLNMPQLASGLHFRQGNRFPVQQNLSVVSGKTLGSGREMGPVPIGALAIPTEGGSNNHQSADMTTSQVRSTIFSNYHLCSDENLNQQGAIVKVQEVQRNAAGTACMDGSVAPAIGEVDGLVIESGAATSKAANVSLEDLDSGGGSRDEEDDGEAEGEHLPPGSYNLVEMDAGEILAEHTHFCEICGKGFKRDANLRMHMRGHGDEYKTPAALARPERYEDPSGLKPRRYSCPFEGCKRNKDHRKFVPLKTVLCVKNHYRRSHCPKLLTCSKCQSKKFSVVADLKTHEKHCGCDKWLCSCGTTFSRKDKLLGHIGLFHGHIPSLQDMNGSSTTAVGVAAAAAVAINGGSGYLISHERTQRGSD